MQRWVKWYCLWKVVEFTIKLRVSPICFNCPFLDQLGLACSGIQDLQRKRIPLYTFVDCLNVQIFTWNCWQEYWFEFSLTLQKHWAWINYSPPRGVGTRVRFCWVCGAGLSENPPHYSLFRRYERSSRVIRNLSNCERKAWKKFRLQRDSNPWPLRYRCSALPTELWSHNCWEQVNFSGSIMPLRVIQHYSDWGFVPRLWVMTLWKIFAADTQFKQLRKKSLKKIQASAGFEPVTSAIPVQCSTNWAMKP